MEEWLENKTPQINQTETLDGDNQWNLNKRGM